MRPHVVRAGPLTLTLLISGRMCFINSLKTFINAPDPDLTILLDIDPVKGFERKSGDSMDRIESSGLKFFNDVRNGYLELANQYPRIKCIDAEKDANTISLEIINLVESL